MKLGTIGLHPEFDGLCRRLVARALRIADHPVAVHAALNGYLMIPGTIDHEDRQRHARRLTAWTNVIMPPLEPPIMQTLFGSTRCCVNEN